MKKLQTALIAWGPLGVLILSFIESIGIPNPGGTDWVLLYLAAQVPTQAYWIALLATVGSVAGSMVFLEATRKGGEKFLRKYTSSGRGAKFRGWFLRYGLVTVFISALLPIPIMPLKVFAACAGAMGCSRGRYFAVMAGARIPRYFALAYLGQQLGQEGSLAWVSAHKWHMLGVAAVIFIALYLLVQVTDRRRGSRNMEEAA